MAKTSKRASATELTRGLAQPTGFAGSPAAESDRLGTMRINELQRLFAEVTGKSTRCPNRVWLVKAILDVAEPATVDEFSEVETAASGADGSATSTGDDSDADEADRHGPASEAETPTQIAGSDDTPVLTEGSLVQPVGTEAGRQAAPAQGLSKLGIPELQSLYAQTVGRTTASTSRNYLIYKIRAAQKGSSPVGPHTRHQKTGDAIMVLPLRMEADLVDRLDESWRRQGLRSRMDLFRRALQSYLAGVGENDVAALLASEA